MASAAAPDAAARVPGKYERLARERHLRDLELAGGPDVRGKHPRGLWYDTDSAEHAVLFVETLCRHSKGEWAGQLIVLEDWQKDDIIRPLFGWMRADGTRRYRIGYVEIARKNGKSLLCAALALYLTVADGEPGSEVYSSATKKDQAKLVHDAAAAMVRASPELRRFMKVQRNNISCEETGSKFEPLGADSSTLDGLNPHGNIIDELHAHRDRGVWDVLDTAMGARRQPLTIAITTAGTYEPESIGWLQHDHATKVLEQVFEDDAFFAFIAAAAPEDDWTLPETWAKANPNIDISIKRSYLAEQCAKAQLQPSFENNFKRLHLNLWTQQRDRWIQIEKWLACGQAPIDLEALQGRVCYGGLDLSSKLDLSALCLVFPREKMYDLLFRFWIPKNTLLERAKGDLVPYDAWERDEHLIATPGDVIDYDMIRAEINALAGRYEIRELAYDPYSATQLATQLMGDGLTLVEHRQGFLSMSEPSKEFEKAIISCQIRHGNHPVMTWMVSNAAIRRDPADNIKPDKSAAADRIDGVVAAVMALGRAIIQPEDHGSVYESRGVRTV